MASWIDHPTVLAVRGRPLARSPGVLDASELRAICLESGADDAGFVSLSRPKMDAERADILRIFPHAKTVIAIVCRMNADAVRSPARNVANLEFHETGDEISQVSRRIVERLSSMGIRAVAPPMAFPMEMDRFPGKAWSISLKPLAVAAGLGQMGIHRNVIHPRFGNFILLGSVLIATGVTTESSPIDFNPCLSCKLCVAACPVGAIASDGGFNFASCFTHNYREFMSGFTDWVETVADSRSAADYQAKVSDSESASMWQSLAYGPNYKAAYCMAVCPAGEDVITPFLENKSDFVKTVVRPLQDEEEMLYVQPNSDAEDHAKKRFPHKRTRRVGNVLRPSTIRGFVGAMQHAFQPGQSKALNAVYHFRFTGSEPADCTVTIRDQRIEVVDGLRGDSNFSLTADSQAWLRFLRKQANLFWLIVTLRVRFRGDPRLLAAFGRCFV